MRRIVMWLSSTAVLVALLFGYHTSTPQSQGTVGAQGADPTTSTRTASGSGKRSNAATTTTTTGPVIATQWGPVQVQITTSGGGITDVQVLQHPTGNPMDDQINAYALPRLVDETISAQDANIDMISGATVTSQGYLQSLQAAIDSARA